MIASDVSTFSVTLDGSKVYYAKNMDEGKYSLYYRDLKAEESNKITSDASNGFYYLSSDGKGVYFFEEGESKVGGSSYSTGTLMYSEAGGEPVKIATDVVTGSLKGYLKNYSSITGTKRVLDSKHIFFNKYLSATDNGNLITNLCFYNGTESVAIAKDVYYNQPTGEYAPAEEAAPAAAPPAR